MTIKSGFYDATNGVPTYGSEDFGEILGVINKNGIVKGYLDEFDMYRSGRTVFVKPGAAFHNGKYFISDSIVEVPIPDPGENTRLDNVVIEWVAPTSEQAPSLKCITGTSSELPTVTDSASAVYEILASSSVTGTIVTLTDERNIVGASRYTVFTQTEEPAITGDETGIWFKPVE